MREQDGFKKWISDGSSLVFSELSEYFEPVKSQGLALKYVQRGEEVYLFNNRRYAVKENQFLVTNENNCGFVEIESKQKVVGICINLSSEILQQVAASHIASNAAEPDTNLADFLLSQAMPEQILSTRFSKTGFYLEKLSQHFLEQKDTILDTNELFFEVAENVILEFTHIHQKINALDAIKPLTQKDLFLKLEKTRKIIESEFVHPINAQVLADEAGLSLYHFIRLFKKCYGQTPIQMLISCRMNHAQKMLKIKDLSINEVAINCGFSDLQTFSKAFKKHTGVNPSTFKISNF
ncbi:MAG: helix-turn-helix transcriptional regulator [Spirosomataceae bacterium]